MKTLRRTLPLTLACALLACASAFAQEDAAPAQAPAADPAQQAMMEAWQKAGTPGTRHAQLAEHFAGTWDTKQTMWMDASAPPMVETGKSVDTAVLGGRQIQTAFESRFMDQPFTGIGFTGYDNVRGKYVSTWTDSMSTGVMVSEGEYDPATKTYTFRGQMPDPTREGATMAVRETIRIVDADHHVMEMFEPHEGQEVRTMQIEYTRAD